jgi:hypothetical protein
VTKLLQCLRDEFVRRDYAAPTIRSYVQIVEAFRQHTGARLDRITPTQLRRYHLFRPGRRLVRLQDNALSPPSPRWPGRLRRAWTSTRTVEHSSFGVPISTMMRHDPNRTS